VVLKGSRVLREGPMTEKELVASVMSVGRRMYLTEDVTRPEAIGKVNITNAVRHFADKGVLLPLGNSPRGRDTRLVLDEDARGRYMGQMKVLFFSRQLRPAPRFQR